jgi:sigma-B regulation protein RsbQ
MDILTRNHVQVMGQGQPMMFVHGFGCDQNMWRFITPAFERSHQIILLDLVGAGKSDVSAYRRSKYSSLQGYADDILEICAELQLKEVVFVGHSVSAMIGILAAIRQPSVFSKLVLVGPSPCYINQEDYLGGFSKADIEGLLASLDNNYLGWSAQIAPVIMGRPDRPGFGEELTNSFCRTDPEIAKHFARVTFLSDNRADLPKLRIPSLVLQCSNDVIAPDSVGEYVHRHLAGSTFHKLKANGHCPHLSSPQETIEAIQAYIGGS